MSFEKALERVINSTRELARQEESLRRRMRGTKAHMKHAACVERIRRNLAQRQRALARFTGGRVA
jgi:hypothetical protein